MAQKRITFSLDEKLIEQLRKSSKDTMIPQSKIVESAIKDKLKELESAK